MNRLLLILPGCLGLFCAVAPLAAYTQSAPRKLVVVQALEHDPLFIDIATVSRRGTAVAFKYVLDVFVEFEGKTGWKSNEIEALIDCAQKTFVIRRVVAYPGPRATGTATGVHSFMAPAPNPEKITPRSTFAHLEEHLCRNTDKKG
jgi:hypothetical protein